MTNEPITFNLHEKASLDFRGSWLRSIANDPSPASFKYNPEDDTFLISRGIWNLRVTNTRWREVLEKEKLVRLQAESVNPSQPAVTTEEGDNMISDPGTALFAHANETHELLAEAQRGYETALAEWQHAYRKAGELRIEADSARAALVRLDADVFEALSEAKFNSWRVCHALEKVQGLAIDVHRCVQAVRDQTQTGKETT